MSFQILFNALQLVWSWLRRLERFQRWKQIWLYKNVSRCSVDMISCECLLKKTPVFSHDLGKDLELTFDSEMLFQPWAFGGLLLLFRNCWEPGQSFKASIRSGGKQWTWRELSWKSVEVSTCTVFLGEDCGWPRIKRCLGDFCVLTYNEDVRSCFRCVRQFEYVWMLIWTLWQQHCQVLVSRRMRRSTHSPGLMEPCCIEHLAVDFQKKRKQETNFPANFH